MPDKDRDFDLFPRVAGLGSKIRLSDCMQVEHSRTTGTPFKMDILSQVHTHMAKRIQDDLDAQFFRTLERLMNGDHESLLRACAYFDDEALAEGWDEEAGDWKIKVWERAKGKFTR